MKKDYSVGIEANKVYKQKLLAKIIKLAFLFLLVLFSVIYFLLYIVYSKSNFVISLDKNAQNKKNVFLSESGKYEDITIELQATSLDYMDNISIDWIKKDVDTEADGSHNGNNYIAYSFYVINCGSEEVNYWYRISLDEIVKEADEALRIMIYRNGEKEVYAKKSKNGDPEKGTKEFYSESFAVMEEVKSFKPNGKDRFTIVVWLEGDDPECIDNIIGGKIKLQMDITEEHINKEGVEE